MAEFIKNNLMDLLIVKLEDNLSVLIESALEAKSAATSEESKPENKYDTRGLEASYLAGAQAERTSVMQKEIDSLRRLTLREFTDDDWIDLTAMIKVVSDTEITKYFLLLPYGGGTKVEYKEQTYFVITPKSPIGMQLFRKKVGDVFIIKNQGVNIEYEIQQIL